MPGRASKRTTTRAAGIERHFEPPLDLTRIEPDSLRDRVYNAVSALTPAKQARLRDRLLAGLGKAGVHVGSCLLILGVSANRPSDLTPLEIAKLLRYVRLNRPAALEAVADDVSELLAPSPKSQEAVRRAA